MSEGFFHAWLRTGIGITEVGSNIDTQPYQVMDGTNDAKWNRFAQFSAGIV
jgi:hypothetical protein